MRRQGDKTHHELWGQSGPKVSSVLLIDLVFGGFVGRDQGFTAKEPAHAAALVAVAQDVEDVRSAVGIDVTIADVEVARHVFSQLLLALIGDGHTPIAVERVQAELIGFLSLGTTA